jgi:hypothetical protein
MTVYQGEVLGEALFSALAANADTPIRYRQFAAMLQLETEAKARLRPFLIRLGLSVVEDEKFRAEGYRAAERLAALSWPDFLDTFEREIAEYRDLYQAIADRAPAEDHEALQAMANHEKIFIRFVTAERAGRPMDALREIESELQHPLGPPAASGARAT